MIKLVFIDTETTGLADECDIWEIGLIARTDAGDVEYCWQLRPSMEFAEPTGLRIGRYYERLDPTLRGFRNGWSRVTTHPELATDPTHGHVQETRHAAITVAQLLDGAILIGAVPDFDARHLSRWLREYGQVGTWHYHLVDVETLAAGALRMPPKWDFDKVLAAYGLTYDEADRHTALGDARMVRDLYDAIMTAKDDA